MNDIFTLWCFLKDLHSLPLRRPPISVRSSVIFSFYADMAEQRQVERTLQEAHQLVRPGKTLRH